MNILAPFFSLLFFLLPLRAEQAPLADTNEIYLRVNQLGYFPEDNKVAIAFSRKAIREKVQLIDHASQKVVLEIKPQKIKTETWGNFDRYYSLDFSDVEVVGEYFLQTAKSKIKTPVFNIGKASYENQHENLLTFMRQQRCGYNPTLDMVCHQKDGRSFFGPMPDSTYVDLSGGWHDAGDQLKYMITSSYATAHMLMAYEMYPDRFADGFNALGQPGANGIPDIG